jgi:hypothetical protein
VASNLEQPRRLEDLTSIVAKATVWKLNSAKLMCRQGLQAWTMF